MTNFPKIAYRSYLGLKHDFNFSRITKTILKRLKKHRDPAKRARLVFREIDQYLKELFKDDAVEKLVSCKAGCSTCCHTQVSVTQDEASLLAQHVVDGVDIDMTRLLVQSQAGNSSENWYRLDHNTRGCLFLDEQGNCRVYEDRPSVCRTNYVVSDPNLCATENGTTHSVRLLNTYKADMAIIGAYQSSKENGALPQMLLKAIDKLLESRKDHEVRSEK